MQTLNRHSVTKLAAILLPDGQFKHFCDLPASLRVDKSWRPEHYDAFCQAVASQVRPDQRAREGASH
eukprot:1330345-Rhodomonas_salina.1